MDIETLVTDIKKIKNVPSDLTFYVNKTRNMARVRGFTNSRFDSIAIVSQQGKIKIMLVMNNRLVHVPKFGYIGVRSFDDASKVGTEIIRLNRLR